MNDFEVVAYDDARDDGDGHDFCNGDIGCQQAAPESGHGDIAKTNGAAGYEGVPDAVAVVESRTWF